MHSRHLLLAASVAAATGCASSPHAKFESIYPGMTSEQVVESMRSGPTRTREYADGSNAWYYGEDLCVLLREDRVVSKQHSEKTETLSVMGVASLSETRQAFCAPPSEQTPQAVQKLETPFGSVRNPGAIVDGVKDAAQSVLGDDDAE